MTELKPTKDYSIAPQKKYPTPILQLNKALSFISVNAEKLHVDTSFVVLGGDSAGSMISATVANVITNPEYAEMLHIQPGLNANQLKGLLLYCGVYDMDDLSTEGILGHFIKHVKRAYLGTSDIAHDHLATTSTVTDHLTHNFPNTFISAGNKDPLLKQSKLLAEKLAHINIPVDTLFFSDDENINLGHEYQFTLDGYGALALDRSLQFVQSLEDR